MIKLIKPNIGLWLSSESSPETLQIVYNFAGWKFSAVYVNQTNLKVKLSKKLRGQAGGQPKIWEGHGPPRLPIEPPVWGYHCSVTYVLDNGEVIMRISYLLLHNITSQGNDNASQNESKWKFQWRKRWTVLFSQSE